MQSHLLYLCFYLNILCWCYYFLCNRWLEVIFWNVYFVTSQLTLVKPGVGGRWNKNLVNKWNLSEIPFQFTELKLLLQTPPRRGDRQQNISLNVYLFWRTTKQIFIYNTYLNNETRIILSFHSFLVKRSMGRKIGVLQYLMLE